MTKKKLRFIVSLAFSPLVLSSATINNNNYSNDTKVYVTFDAGNGYFNGDKTKKVITYTVPYGRQWKDFANDEKPSEVTAPTNYTFEYYTLDDKEIMPTQPFISNCTVTAHYSYEKPSTKPTTPEKAEQLWHTCSWDQLCSIADEGFGDSSGNGLIGYFGLKYPTKDSFIGLTKNLTYNNKTYSARVIGVDHDELANGDGAAALTFEFTNAIPGLSYDGYSKNSNVWSTSQLRNYLNGNEFGNLIESGIKNNAKKVYKTTNSGNRAGSNAVDSVEDTFFPLSLKEMGISNYPYNYIDSITATCNKTDLKDGDTVTKDMFTVQAIKDGIPTTVTDFDCNPALPYTLQSTDVPGRTFKISYKDKSVITDTVSVAKIEKSILAVFNVAGKTFNVGDQISSTDVTVYKVYSDGTKTELGSTEYTTNIGIESSPYTFVEGDRGIKNIIFTAKGSGKTFTLGANVGLTSLTVTPTVTTFVAGESVESSNFKVVAHYGDSKSAELTEGQYTTDISLPYICLNSDVASGKTITFSYNGQEQHVTLTVKPALKEIHYWLNSNIGMQRIVGASITKDWFDVQAFYSDGSSESVTDWTSDISLPVVTSETGYHRFNFTYKGLTMGASVYIHSGFDHIEADTIGGSFTKGNTIDLTCLYSIRAIYKYDSYYYQETQYISPSDSHFTYSPDIRTGHIVTEEEAAAGSLPVDITFTDIKGETHTCQVTFNTYQSTNGLNTNNSLNSNKQLENITKLNKNNNLTNNNVPNSSPYTVEEEGSTYKYYETHSSADDRKKSILGKSDKCIYWARSPETLTYSFAWGIGSDGNVGIYNDDYKENSPIDVREANAVVPCFAIGKTKQNRVAIENNNQSIISSSNPRNILWDQQYTTKLSLNTNKYYSLAQHCEMFGINDINPANFSVAVGYDNSKDDPSKSYKQIIPLTRVNDVSANAGYSIVSDGASNPTYTVTVSTPEMIWNSLGLIGVSKSCFAGIYIMANATIKDDWNTLYTFARNNQYYLSSHYAPGVTKDLTLNGKTYTTRLIGINEDVTSGGTNAGMTFEFYSPYELSLAYGQNDNSWMNSDYRQALSVLTEDLKAATANQDFTTILKKTVDGLGSETASSNEETIFGLSLSEMGITQSDYSAQHYQFKDKRDSSIVSSEEGNAYSYYSKHSFFMNNLLRYKVSAYDYNDIWLRSPVSASSNKVFYLSNYVKDSFIYIGQVKSDKYDSSHHACPCFAF